VTADFLENKLSDIPSSFGFQHHREVGSYKCETHFKLGVALILRISSKKTQNSEAFSPQGNYTN
jgi:hypothetical protein